MLNHNNHNTTWVVVADNGQAKIYRMVKFPKIEEISHIEHPESRLHNRELVEARAGRGVQRGGGVRYSYQSEVEPKQLEADKFAASLSQHLAKSHANGEFHRLYVIAGPSFIGMLRRHMNPQVRKTIVAELDKELTHEDKASTERHLADM